jgi:hypothetical protein
MDEAESDVAVFMVFAKGYRINPLDWVNGEIQWRTQAIGARRAQAIRPTGRSRIAGLDERTGLPSLQE